VQICCGISYAGLVHLRQRAGKDGATGRGKLDCSCGSPWLTFHCCLAYSRRLPGAGQGRGRVSTGGGRQGLCLRDVGSVRDRRAWGCARCCRTSGDWQSTSSPWSPVPWRRPLQARPRSKGPGNWGARAMHVLRHSLAVAVKHAAGALVACSLVPPVHVLLGRGSGDGLRGRRAAG
jgi:hypothetical protein